MELTCKRNKEGRKVGSRYMILIIQYTDEWPDLVSSDELYERAGVAQDGKKVKKTRWRCIARILWMQLSTNPAKKSKDPEHFLRSMVGKEMCAKRRSRKDSLMPCAPLKHGYDDDDDDDD